MNSLKESLRKAIDRNLALQESQKGAKINDEDEDILFEKTRRTSGVFSGRARSISTAHPHL